MPKVQPFELEQTVAVERIAHAAYEIGLIASELQHRELDRTATAILNNLEKLGWSDTPPWSPTGPQTQPLDL